MLTFRTTREEDELTMLVCFSKNGEVQKILLNSIDHGCFAGEHLPSIGALDEGARFLHDVRIRQACDVSHFSSELPGVIGCGV